MTPQEYNKEQEKLRNNLDKTQSHLNELIEENEKDYCEIRAEKITQWENSEIIARQQIKISNLEYRLSKCTN